MARITMFAEPEQGIPLATSKPAARLERRESTDSLIEDLLALHLQNGQVIEPNPVYVASRPRRSPRKKLTRRKPALCASDTRDNIEQELGDDIPEFDHLDLGDSETDLSGFIVRDSADDEELRKPWDGRRISSAEDSFETEKPAKRTNKRLFRRKDLVNFSPARSETSLQSNSPHAPENFSHGPPNGTDNTSFPAILSSSFNHSCTSEAEDSPTTPPLAIAEPVTPREAILVSPSKAPRIPQSPHRPSQGAFWSVEEVNTWNNTHSPPKILEIKHFRRPCWDSDSDSEDDCVIISPLKLPTPFTNTHSSPTEDSDSASSEMGRHRNNSNSRFAEAQQEFNRIKRSTAFKFLNELDKRVVGGKLAELAAPGGGFHIEWSNTLNKTGGTACWKRISKDSSPNYVVRQATIVLASKVITDMYRLHNTLAHEFCHLVNMKISNVWKEHHGSSFKAWGRKVEAAFPELKIHVTTKHSYAIHWRYLWECSYCKRKCGRHSKSIDPAKQVCASCKGNLVQVRPVPRKTQESPANKTERTGWQAFLKDNLTAAQKENPKLKWGEVVKILSVKYRAAQQQKNPKVDGKSLEMVRDQSAATAVR